LPVDRSSHALARRLKALRVEHWPDAAITQGQLAKAFDSSAPLLSSWENGKVPPSARLAAYATFFATRRSIEDGYRVLDLDELTEDELEYREELLAELTELAEVDTGAPASSSSRGFWYFPDAYDITIVVAQLPDDQLPKTPFTDPASPDYVELYTYADLDSLIELHGHIRSLNPGSQVHFRTAEALSPDDYTTHLVLLGGVDWNVVTRDVVDRVELPVNQPGRSDVSDVGGFEVVENGETRLIAPLVVRGKLIEDVAQFYRGISPYNKKRTVTICGGMYGRGTLGAVRALTDAKFRDRNTAYLKDRFAGHDAYSVITRVTIVNGRVVTPDWTLSENRLFEWPGGQG
jgi:transcriptional regulator with XRE-family HTH domain